jgi:hypothetical protein
MKTPVFLAAMLAAGVANAGSAKPVRIYVGPVVRDGFVEADKGVLDSIKDIQKELRKDRTYAVVAGEAEAALKLYVVTRRTRETGGSVGIGTATGTGSGGFVQGTGMTVSIPLAVYRLETLLRVGTHERPFTGESDAAWKGSARAVAKDLAVWVAANRERIP